MNEHFPPLKRNPGQSRPWLLICLIVLVMVLVFHRYLAIFSYNFFSRTDHMLQLNHRLSPLLMWGILGWFAGMAAGGFIIGKKYNLTLKWKLIPAVAGVVLVLLLTMWSSPIGARTETAAVTAGKDHQLALATVTDSLENYKQSGYGGRNLTDNNVQTAWLFKTGREDQLPSASFLFTQNRMTNYVNVKIAGIRLQNGYSRMEAKFKDYNRIRQFTVYLNNREIYSGTAKDEFRAFQEFAFDQVRISPGDILKVSINSLYPGTKRGAGITALSELQPMISSSSF